MTDKILNEVYLSRIEKLKKEKAELLEALKSLRGMEPWIGDIKVLEFFQKTVYTAIENAEKK